MEASSIHYGAILSTAAALISAVASVSLVLIALLFREEVRAARRRPDLRLLFDVASANDCITIAIGSREECWVRFRVRNEMSKEVAVSVQLLLLEVSRKGVTQHPAVPIRPFSCNRSGGRDYSRRDTGWRGSPIRYLPSRSRLIPAPSRPRRVRQRQSVPLGLIAAWVDTTIACPAAGWHGTRVTAGPGAALPGERRIRPVIAQPGFSKQPWGFT